MNELLMLIEKEYSNGEFDFEDLLAKAPYRKSKLYGLLDELMEAKKVVKIANGTYKLKETNEIRLPKEIISLLNKLTKTITMRFKFTGLSVLLPLVHHMPYSVAYLLYVETGSGEDFKETISRLAPGFTVLIEPKKEDVLLLINEGRKNKILIIRENSYFYVNEHGMSHKDTAFVDLYFEVSRDKIPFMKTDVKEILKELILKDLINYSRLMRYAHERGLTMEIKKMLMDLSKEVELPKGGLDVLQRVS